MAPTMKNAVFWDLASCDSCKNQRFGGTCRLHHQDVFFRSVPRLLATANVVPNSAILVTLMMEAIRSSETSVLIRATRRIIPEDVILRTHSLFSIQFLHLQKDAVHSAHSSPTYSRLPFTKPWVIMFSALNSRNFRLRSALSRLKSYVFTGWEHAVA
jgi:hypothetical protein